MIRNRGLIMRIMKGFCTALMGLAALGVSNAMAADLGGSMKDGPVEYEVDYGAGWMIRGRAIGVIPDEGSKDWTVDGRAAVDGYYGLAIDSSVVPELDFTYFFNRNLAVEIIAGVTPHDIDGKLAIDDYGKIGDVWLLPPTVTLQYHFELAPGIKPYVGAGLNYTVFFNEDSGPNYSNLKLDNTWGWGLQAGVDFHLQGNWFLNVDVKRLWINTDATVTLLDHHAVTTNVDIDPWIVGVGLGYRFGGHPSPLK
jgi:outer membrane protein